MQAFWKFIFIVGAFQAVLGAEDDEGNGGPDLDPETIAKIVKEVDKDGDGKISMDELLNSGALEEEAEKEVAAKLFKQSDKDGDGLLNLEEIPVLLANIQAMDEPGDGDDDDGEEL
mmetsp:Transcript_25094/g.70763  ORF Transcript_25094/g.70763 Transcript_25094/m.70763 type:complete len:116 (-) Transcript_25094:71-418(-)|eukprot:CAMPEP_0179231414 /NCGR_PEP_ID=MMETSP0797-20121207/11331_1 /TAXON_ID=47934 /ORGANISM="Dinophysis acuminata, Strain DAEP01" /LENGTH=115 /DNA_ID=CAMNT_0020938501 /DNA_START=86 /DNA_END=433 /DNA_ORIENTATION=-